VARYEDPNNAMIATHSASAAVTPASWILALGAIVALGFAGYFYYQSSQAVSQAASSAAAISQSKQQLAKLSQVAEHISFVDSEGKKLSSLFDAQKRWETVLDNVQARLYRSTIITSIDLSKTGSVNLSGVTDGFTSYGQLYSSLTDPSLQPYLTAVRPVSVTKQKNDAGQYPGLPAEVVGFSFSMSLTPAAYSTTTPLN